MEPSIVTFDNTLAPCFIRPTRTDHDVGCVVVYITWFCNTSRAYSQSWSRV